MAKTEGDQNVPSGLLDAYRATLGEVRPDAAVHKRYPWRMPTMQAGKANETAKQRIQRNRFNTVRAKFNTLSPAERARWYAGMPPWSSLLWYYNYFMLSGLNDVLGADARGASVIKSIQNRTIELPTAGTTITHATVVDASKVVVMLWGASYAYDWDQVGDIPYAWAWPVYPIWGTLNNTNISITWGMLPEAAAKVALQVIEYL